MIRNAEGMSDQEIIDEIRRGGRLVVYQWCVSVIIMTFKRGTDVYLVKSGRSAILPGLPYTLLTLAVGWWGIPWGPIYSIQTLWRNLGGGIDVTQQMVRTSPQ